MGKRVGKLPCLMLLLLLLCIPQKWGILAAEEEMEERTEEPAGEDGSEVEGEEEELEEEEPEEPVIPFQAVIPPPDGAHGYYVSVPVISIVHPGQTGVTRYRVTDGSGQTTEGFLKEAGAQTELSGNVWSEGKNHLWIWMEDDSGNRLEAYTMDQELWIDTVSPVIRLKTQNGFAYWYSQYADLEVSVAEEDTVSPLESVWCKTAGEKIGESEENVCTFRIEQLSENGKGIPVTVTARDRAGNQSEAACTLYIDGLDPRVNLEGSPDSGIAGGPVVINAVAADENRLDYLEAGVEWTDIDGRVTRTPVTDWRDAEGGTQAVISLEQDGDYRIRFTAADGAGHTAVTEERVLIDTKSPQIRYVEELQGKYLSHFYWNFRTEELIWDYTSVAYMIHLDGELYSMGTMEEREGQHVLEICAVDAAGNISSARAEFVIDHTAPQIQFENLEEGGEYREMHTFRVRLANPADQICKITINGLKQRLSSEEGVYSFTVEEEQNYEVAVLAEDLAGNQAEEKIRFRVLPRETLVEKIIRPVARAIGLGRDMDDGSVPEKVNLEKKEKETAGTFSGIIILFGMAAAGIVCICVKKKIK